MGGDDVAEVRGDRARIMVRIDGGGGDDQLINSSRAGAAKTRFYDARGDDLFVVGDGAEVSERPFERPPAQNGEHEFGFDWGSRGRGSPIAAFSPDLGLFVGYSRSLERFGFRKVPFQGRHAFQLGVATARQQVLGTYDGQFRELWPKLEGLVHLEYSGINILRFHGFGNGTQLSGSSSFYKVVQPELEVSLGLEWQGGGNRGGRPGAGAETLRQAARIGVGPLLKYSDTPTDANSDRFIATLDPPVPGLGAFGQIGARAWLVVDTRDNSGSPKSGVHLAARGAVYPAIWDNASTFSELQGSASAYLTARIPTEPTLALRVGGEKLWGTFPFHEAAFLGGSADLRGFRSERFAGDGAAFGNAELRFDLVGFNLLVPIRLGLFAAADAGRVFFDQDPAAADTWHTAFGGGVSMSIIDRLQTFTLAFMNGGDLTGAYLSAGFAF